MSLTILPAREADPEGPSASADLTIEVGPDQPRGYPNGEALPSRADDLITAFGILGSVVAGIAGAVLTLRKSPGLVTPALAELALAGTSAALIARAADRRTPKHQEIAQAPRPPGERRHR
jgi:hypothetical protein